MKKGSNSRYIPDIKNISTIVFDVGDTLFATTALMESALRKTAALMKKERLIEAPARFYRTYLEVDRHIVGPTVNHLFSGLEIIERVYGVLGLKSSPLSLSTFLSIYREFIRCGIRRDVRLVAAFRRLRRSGNRIAILTDGSTEEQLEQVFRLGLAPYVDLMVTSQQVGVEKPGRQMFDFLFSSLAVTAGECMMVGNDMERDIHGAKAAGMLTVLVTAYSRHQKLQSLKPADFVVKDVTSLVGSLLD